MRTFQPRLVGPVLSGEAGAHSDVTLHLFAETAEEVGLFLNHHHIPYDQAERRLRLSRDTHRSYPVFSFRAGDTAIDLVVFPLDGLRQAPLSPVDGRPEPRATLGAVRSLL